MWEGNYGEHYFLTPKLQRVLTRLGLVALWLVLAAFVCNLCHISMEFFGFFYIIL